MQVNEKYVMAPQPELKSFKIHIDMCSTTQGYSEMYHIIEKALRNKYGNRVIIEVNTIPGQTGCMEIKLHPFGSSFETVIYSILAGDMLIDESNVDELMNKIDNVIVNIHQ